MTKTGLFRLLKEKEIFMNIITISREFGSGGREIGKRLADALGYAYYDKEIEIGIARRMNMDENFIAGAIDRGVTANIPLHFGRTIANSYAMKQQVDILVEKQRVLEEFATASDCVIVGRAADVILSEYEPLKIFVYADMEYKINRCQGYAEVGENPTRREMEKAIKKIDSGRMKYHSMFLDADWGDKRHYHLCVNTSGIEIKKIVPAIAQYARCWFDNQNK